jgi:Na+/melibiose symporter-like transporter
MSVTRGGAGGKRLDWGQLAIFSLPVLLIQAIEIPWRVYLPSFLTGSLGLGLAGVGALLAAVRLFDVGFDLFVGWASDRWPTRFGRRKPWMAAGVPLIMAGTVGLFLAPVGTSLMALGCWALLLHAGYTLVVTPHGGWGLEVGRNAGERLRVIGVKTWFGVLATPLILFVPSLLERQFGADRAAQIAAMAVAILLLAPSIIALVLRTIPEAEQAAVPPAPVARRGLFADLRKLVSRPQFLWIGILYAQAGLTEATSSGSFIFFAEGPLGLKGWASTLLLIQAAIALMFLPGWAWLATRIGKRAALTWAFALQSAAMAGILIVRADATAGMLALLAVRYACWGADFLFLRAMVADLAGQAIASGRNSSASHYAAFNVTLRVSLSLGAGLVLWVPALLAARPGDGARFDDAIRLVFAMPACLGGLCGIVLLTRLRAPRGVMRDDPPASYPHVPIGIDPDTIARRGVSALP